MKKIIIVLVALFTVLFSVSCGKKCSGPKCVKNCDIIHEPEFGGIYIKKTIEEFNNMGYEYGDSVNVTFSNGYKLIDLPYYSGYYVDAGEKLLVGYLGYDYIKVAINYGDDMWNVASLKEGDTASIKINKKEKYKDVQTALNITYYDERERYTTDEEFVNFRKMYMGKLKDNTLYRSASPCDNKHKRASYVDKLIEAAEVKYILNLADTKDKIDGYIAASDFNSPYFLSLYRNNKFFLSALKDEKIVPLAMNMNYTSKEFAEKLVSGFVAMSSSDGPYLVHCLEGKDRTGFVCIVLEALADANYQDIVDDYMFTYKNYYGIDKDDPRYKVIKERNVDAMLKFLVSDDTKDITNIKFSSYIESYLKSSGMTDEELNLFKSKILK